MSVSPFPPGPPALRSAAAGETPSYEAYPAHTHDEPFSSAAAYRSSASPPVVSPPVSPPPRGTSSSFAAHPAAAAAGTSLNGAIAAAGYERASPLKGPPPASTLVIHEPAATTSSSPAPTGSTAAATTAPPRSTTAATGDTRSARTASKRDGTASISKSARSSATSWLYGGPNSFIRIPSRNALAYILVSTVEAAIVITLVAFIFAKIVSQVDNITQNLKTVSVYLAVFVFGCVFQVLIAWDAVRLKNTMQLIGVLIFNIALTITAAIEIRQVRDALNAQDQIAGGFPCPDDPSRLCRARSLFPSVERYLIAVTGVCFVVEFLLTWLTFRLWKEFGWVIYQKIGADLRVRRMFFWYQLFIVFLKFTFFFGVGFTAIYLILVAQTTDWEYGVTIAAVPISIVALFAAGFAVRREWTSLMVHSLLLMIVGLVYFVYKVTQVWVPATRDEYTYVHTTITFISGFAIVSLTLTLLIGFVCLFNFHKGLKPAHDAIGTFGGVHRQRARTDRGGTTDAEPGVLDLDGNVEPKEYDATPPNGGGVHRASVVAADARRHSAMGYTSPVYSPYGEVAPDRRASAVAQPYAASASAAMLANTPVYAPQPVPAALQPGALSPAHSPPPPAHQFYPQQQQAPSQAFLDAHQPRPTASRISLD
ncbi:uncharacterized protein SRS1_06425 [Sporisorium reilianum f. sp. reilianum]|uniref:Uncharacterized protein n=1 Tax=Sporisorium reilianum f. sp. reilianum TaxID=72559 RepID=A0A2N8U6W7_9BASI|nr:uncharacterized protein SRS1_06425 [Sporisorium reilianum f. sp. reilianum]